MIVAKMLLDTLLVGFEIFAWRIYKFLMLSTIFFLANYWVGPLIVPKLMNDTPSLLSATEKGTSGCVRSMASSRA